MIGYIDIAKACIINYIKKVFYGQILLLIHATNRVKPFASTYFK